jgi:hypothetical protein
MGMFDTILINKALLPISEEDKVRLEGETFQTKSLDSCLNIYLITDDKRLVIDKNAGFGTKQTNTNWQHLFITDAIKFYTSAKDNNEWFEFVALFDEGKMLVIRRL